MDSISNKGLTVRLDFLRANDQKWESVCLPLNEYFDLENDESPCIDSLPRFAHAVEYLRMTPELLEHTRLTLHDACSNQSVVITETFWNQGRNRSIERTDSGASSEYWEMINEIKLSEDPETWEILRFGRTQGLLKVISHVVIKVNEDGSESETVLKGIAGILPSL